MLGWTGDSGEGQGNWKNQRALRLDLSSPLILFPPTYFETSRARCIYCFENDICVSFCTILSNTDVSVLILVPSLAAVRICLALPRPAARFCSIVPFPFDSTRSVAHFQLVEI